MDKKPAKKIQQRVPKDQKKKQGGPAIEIDLDALKKIMQFKPTVAIAAGYFDVSKKTIERIINHYFNGMTFVEFREHYMAGTKLKLIQVAMRKALKGDNDMLKYCLNNMCGWSYNPDPVQEHEEIEDMVF